MTETATTKAMKTSKIVIGIILGLFVFAIASKIIVYLVAFIGALGLGALRVHISESPEAYRYVQDIANILGVVGGAYFFLKIYKRINRPANCGVYLARQANKSSTAKE